MTDQEIENAIVREVTRATDDASRPSSAMIGAGQLERSVLGPVRERYKAVLGRLVASGRIHAIRWPKERSYSLLTEDQT